MRGFLGGIVLGLILCGAGLVTLSLWSPLAPTPEVTTKPVQPVAPTGGQAGIEGQQPDPEISAAPPVSPVASKPEAGDLTDIVQIDSTTMRRPAVDSTAEDPAVPDTAAPLPRIPAPAEMANPISSPVIAPDAPAQDSDVGVDTTAPEVPVADDTLGAADILFRTEPDAAGASTVSATRDDEVDVNAPLQIMADPTADALPRAAVDPAPQPEVSKGPELIAQSDIAAPLVPGTEETSPIVLIPQAAVAPVLETATEVSDQPAQALPRIAPLPQAGVETGATGPTVGTRVIPLTERHRAPPQQAGQDETLRAADQPPLELYAEPFENSGGNPVMAIILTDPGTDAALDHLRGFPFPVTIAIDPTTPDATERMARYRDAGLEVLVLVDLPKFATARDVEVALAAGFDILPESVGLLEGTGLQGNRELSAQVVAVANGTGRGLVTSNTGLNSSLKLAQSDGVPSAAVFRDFDGAGQDPATIQRSLDQAVFRASQDGSVTVTGRLHPATIRILQAWVGDHRASRVALAPVSAVLRLSGSGS